MTQSIAAMALVLAVLFALRALLRWRGVGAGAGAAATPRLLSACAVGPRQRVCVVEAAGDRLLLGVTEHNVSLLHVLPETSEASEEAPPTRGRGRLARLRLSGVVGITAIALLIALVAPPAAAQPAPPGAAQPAPAAVGQPTPGEAAGAVLTPAPSNAEAAPRVTLSLEGPDGAEGLSPAFQMLGLLTVIAIAPSLLLLGTCFTRIVVVLAFLRQAIGLQHMPPNQVLIGLALFLTAAVMAPVAEQVRRDAYEPLVAKQIDATEAGERALVPIRGFLLESTREADLALFLRISKLEAPEELAETPLTVLLPAYVISELRTAFEIGFMIFLPFLVIDLIVSSLLISMGMIVLPPIVVSLPFKLMLFVLVDGWNLVLSSLALGLV